MGGKDAENPAQFTGKSWGPISVDGVHYSWFVPDHPDIAGSARWPGAPDSYIYSCFIRPQTLDTTQADFDLSVHKPGALFLARVHKDHIFAGRDAYEWFAGMQAGKPAWGPLAGKRPVFENPEGTGLVCELRPTRS